jgi:hypothetical protein
VRRVVLAVLLLAVLGCAPTTWYHPSYHADRFNADVQACRVEANSLAGSAAPGGSSLVQTIAWRKRWQGYFDTCMYGRGYSK